MTELDQDRILELRRRHRWKLTKMMDALHKVYLEVKDYTEEHCKESSVEDHLILSGIESALDNIINDISETKDCFIYATDSLLLMPAEKEKETK